MKKNTQEPQISEQVSQLGGSMEVRCEVGVIQEGFNGKKKGGELFYHLFRLANSFIVNDGISRRETTANLAIVACSSGILNLHTFVREERKELFQIHVIEIRSSIDFPSKSGLCCQYLIMPVVMGTLSFRRMI